MHNAQIFIKTSRTKLIASVVHILPVTLKSQRDPIKDVSEIVDRKNDYCCGLLTNELI
jgi:hypothetical protein